jgi:hypothetical protein
MLSTELRLALRPDAMYGELLTHDSRVTWLQMLLRPAVLVFAIGIIIPMMAVHRVSLEMAATSALSWSAAVALELVAAFCVIASARSRPVSMARSIDLWFAGYFPFAIWLLLLPIATLNTSVPPLEIVGSTAIVPTIWSTFIVAAFCRTVLGTSPAGARWRAGIHLGLFVLVASTLFIISAGGGAAVFSYALRRLAE